MAGEQWVREYDPLAPASARRLLSRARALCVADPDPPPRRPPQAQHHQTVSPQQRRHQHLWAPSPRWLQDELACLVPPLGVFSFDSRHGLPRRTTASTTCTTTTTTTAAAGPARTRTQRRTPKPHEHLLGLQAAARLLASYELGDLDRFLPLCQCALQLMSLGEQSAAGVGGGSGTATSAARVAVADARQERIQYSMDLSGLGDGERVAFLARAGQSFSALSHDAWRVEGASDLVISALPATDNGDPGEERALPGQPPRLQVQVLVLPFNSLEMAPAVEVGRAKVTAMLHTEAAGSVCGLVTDGVQFHVCLRLGPHHYAFQGHRPGAHAAADLVCDLLAALCAPPSPASLAVPLAEPSTSVLDVIDALDHYNDDLAAGGRAGRGGQGTPSGSDGSLAESCPTEADDLPRSYATGLASSPGDLSHRNLVLHERQNSGDPSTAELDGEEGFGGAGSGGGSPESRLVLSWMRHLGT